MLRCGFLVVTSPLQRVLSNIPSVLELGTSKHLLDTLYVHLAPGLTAKPSSTADTFVPAPPLVPFGSSTQHIVTQCYSIAASVCANVDVRVVVSNVSSRPLQWTPHNVSHPYQVILTDSSEDQSTSLKLYVQRNFPCVYAKDAPCIPVISLAGTLDSDAKCEDSVSGSDGSNIPVISLAGALDSDAKCEDSVSGSDGSNTHDKRAPAEYLHVCVGGTFDRIHTGHKILLSEACMSSQQRLVVGVTNRNMTKKKLLCELIEPCSVRIQKTKELLLDLKPSVLYEVVPIPDPFGPSIVDEDLQCLVVSHETLKGGHMVNERRQKNGLNCLQLSEVDLVEDVCHAPHEEEKISSSSVRQRLLGTLLKQPHAAFDGTGPYIIGLTGGIASGKSSVCRRLQALGANIIDCDALGHRAYDKDTHAYQQIVAAWGEGVLDASGQINRKSLGKKVFADKDSLSKLNNIVWPVIKQAARRRILELAEEGASVIILDAAVLLEAGWQDLAHEVWTTVIPQTEAIQRIQERDGLDEAQAVARIQSQKSNQDRVDSANVVFCTLWAYEVTQKQVEKAWRLLHERLQR